MDAIYVGIDASKATLDVHVRPSGEAFAVARDGKGLRDLVERLRVIAPTLVVLEATGGFEAVVVAALAAAELRIAVVNPAQVRYFAKALGQRAKSDPIDASVMAAFGAAVKPKPRVLPDATARG
jgi:transposase